MTDLRPLALAHYEELARIGRALSSPVRLRLLDLLRQGPRSVEALAEQAGAPVANVSQHLQQLRAARLVTTEKKGQRVVYALASDSVSSFFASLRDLGEELLPELDRLRTALGAHPEPLRASLLRRILDGEVALLDVRPPEEFRAGHLLGALSIPLPELRERMHELPRDREIVAYGRGPYCPMALAAVDVLQGAGFAARHLDLGPADVRARAERGAIGALVEDPPADRAADNPEPPWRAVRGRKR